MSRRSIKIPPKEVSSDTSTEVEKYDDVLNSLDSIQVKRKSMASSSGTSGNSVKPTTVVMAVVIVAIAATLLLSFGSLPSTQNTESEVKLTDGFDFQIELLNSSQVMLSDFLGEPIILDFFATWCQPCATQIVELQKLQVKHPNVHIISVSIESDDTISVLEGYSLDHGMDWIVGRDVTAKGASRYQITSIPTMAFFNSQGIRKYIDHPPGITSESVMSSWIRAD